MTNLVSISDFRQWCPVNSIVDDASIAASINHAQVTLIPEVTSQDFYFDLIESLEQGHLSDLQKGFLNKMAPALSCYAASHLTTIAGNQIHPTKVVDAMGDGSQTQLVNYYVNQTSAYLHQVYVFCKRNNIPYNEFNSTEFCGLVLGGLYSK